MAAEEEMLLDKRSAETTHFARPNRNTRIGAPRGVGESNFVTVREAIGSPPSAPRERSSGYHRCCPPRFDSIMIAPPIFRRQTSSIDNLVGYVQLVPPGRLLTGSVRVSA